MKPFAFEAPETQEEVLELLASDPGGAVVLAGGTDLVGLMKKMLVAPKCVVSLDRVEELKAIDRDSQQVRIGAMVTLEEILDSQDLEPYRGLKQAIAAMGSQPMQAQGTLGGDLCHKPHCWYFRTGHGLLADSGRLVEEGDNRYHAILGNSGPAKFVSASRLAPALIALGASVSIRGAHASGEVLVPVEHFFHTPGTPVPETAGLSPRDTARQRLRENILLPDEIISQIVLPAAPSRDNAAYEVHHGSGPEDSLAAAAASLVLNGTVVVDARVALGQVAPVPWLSHEAAEAIIGRAVNHATAEQAGAAAVADARPLSGNRYKVQLARVAVKRAILLAAGLKTGGF